MYVYRDCLDCGIRIYVDQSENETIKEKHDFDLNGLCECCDYIRQQEEPNVSVEATVTLPGALEAIEEEAFLNDAGLIAVEIQGDDLTAIGAGAFRGCVNLRQISIPSSVKDIAADAFDGCAGLVIVCEAGSYAQQYADANAIAWREGR